MTSQITWPGPRNVHRNLRVSSERNNMRYANSRSDVSVFYANSRSLVNKIDQLELEVGTYQYDQRRFIWTVLFWCEINEIIHFELEFG